MTTRLMEFREEWSGDDLIGRSEARVLAPADVVGNEDCSYDSHATGCRKKGEDGLLDRIKRDTEHLWGMSSQRMWVSLMCR